VASPGFNLTEAALRKAEREISDAAARVRTQFNRLLSAVEATPNRGAAFTAAQQVATQLHGQAKEFEAFATKLAGDIGFSLRDYVANSEAGVQAINAAGGGETFSRLGGK